ncbi:hypothetical protein NSY55_26685 [Pseudomonas aeruginosa]|nr:hypothetical protein [Pseudomonas aeruginosa]
MNELHARYSELTKTTDRLRLDLIRAAGSAPADAAVQINQGVSRRLLVLHDSITAVFQLVPPENTRSSRETIRKATINLHAFLINTVGIMDNMAWAYLHFHGIVKSVRMLDVDLFKAPMHKILPRAWVDQLTSEQMAGWHKTYLKPYRDALAHRIPPYIPESFSPEETQALQQVEEAINSLLASDWEEASRLQDVKDQMLGHAYSFVHSLDPPIQPLVLHPQLLADFATIGDVLRAFLQVLSIPPQSGATSISS